MLIAPDVKMKEIVKPLEAGVHLHISCSESQSKQFEQMGLIGHTTEKGWRTYSLTGVKLVSNPHEETQVESHLVLGPKYYYTTDEEFLQGKEGYRWYKDCELYWPSKEEANKTLEWRRTETKCGVSLYSFKGRQYLEVYVNGLRDNWNRPLSESVLFVLPEGGMLTTELRDRLLTKDPSAYREMFAKCGVSPKDGVGKGVFDVLVTKWGLNSGQQLEKARTPENEQEHERGR